MPLLSVEDLDVSYGGVRALRGLSLHVEEGEKVALLGANGAGKTTTLRTMSGLVSPRGGTIVFEGDRIDGVPAHKLVRRGLAHLPEGRDLFPSLTVEENLRYGHWTRRRDRADFRRQLDRAMDYFPRLRERRSQIAKTLSGGEQQMLGVARALMSSPKLLLVDELSLGLAPLVVKQLFAILDEVNKDGTAVVLVEQFVHMALAHSDRAYVLAKGEVVMSGRSVEMAGNAELIASYLGEVVEPDTAAPAPRAGRRRNVGQSGR
jgi:branched-chain amino acid transport system ATP-binding protein